MYAFTILPGKANSGEIRTIPEPPQEDGSVLVETASIGVCGTDREILSGEYGTAPPGQDYLVLGHESLGRVLECPIESNLSVGDWVVGIVRRPDPVPCPQCAAGEWDMCSNGRYTERGIKGRHGYCSERYRIEAKYAVKIDPHLGENGVLVEPASVVAKAWEHIEYIGSRARWTPHRVLVTGAGPIGMLAALMGVQCGLEVHILDRIQEGIKPELVRALGATYHTGKIEEACESADVVIETTGAAQLVLDAIRHNSPGGIVCLTGLSSGERKISLDAEALNRDMVLENDVVFGSVNANRRHYEAAAAALAQADSGWLSALITRRVPLQRWREAMNRDPASDVKSVIELKN